MAPSFALPYGRARNRTRRIRSATLWINRDKAVPSYTFRTNGTLHLATAGRRIICGKDSGVKDYRSDVQPACPDAFGARPTDARVGGVVTGNRNTATGVEALSYNTRGNDN